MEGIPLYFFTVLLHCSAHYKCLLKIPKSLVKRQAAETEFSVFMLFF